MFKNVTQWLERKFAIPGVVKDFGVIGDYRHKDYHCEVRAFLRKVDDQIVLTLRHKSKRPGFSSTQYLDLGADGIEGLGETLKYVKQLGREEQRQ